MDQYLIREGKSSLRFRETINKCLLMMAKTGILCYNPNQDLIDDSAGESEMFVHLGNVLVKQFYQNGAFYSDLMPYFRNSVV